MSLKPNSLSPLDMNVPQQADLLFLWLDIYCYSPVGSKIVVTLPVARAVGT
jgi:hypothetical protein